MVPIPGHAPTVIPLAELINLNLRGVGDEYYHPVVDEYIYPQELLDKIGTTLAYDPANLHLLVQASFDETGLRDLCFDLGISFDDLEGAGKSDKARELIVRVQRQGRLPDLLTLIREGAPYQYYRIAGNLSEPEYNWQALRRLFLEHFTIAEIDTLIFDEFFDLFQDIRDISPKTKKIRTFISAVRRHGRIPELLAAVEREKPDAPIDDVKQIQKPEEIPLEELDHESLALLRTLLDERLNAHDIDDLAFDLFLPLYDDFLKRAAKREKIRDILMYAQRRALGGRLMAYLQKFWPDLIRQYQAEIKSPLPQTTPVISHDDVNLGAVRRFIVATIPFEIFTDLVFDLFPDYYGNYLEHSSQPVGWQIRVIIGQAFLQGRLVELLDYFAERWPDEFAPYADQINQPAVDAAPPEFQEAINLQIIRMFMLHNIPSEAIDDLAFDLFFSSVYQNFDFEGQELSKEHRVSIILGYAEDQGQLPRVAAYLQQYWPEAYQQYTAEFSQPEIYVDLVEDIPLDTLLPGQTAVKTWQVVNPSLTTAWPEDVELDLAREREGQLAISYTIGTIPIAQPREKVELSVTFETPEAPGTYELFFRISDGTSLYGAELPLTFTVVVEEFRFTAWPTDFRSINQHFGANPQYFAQFGLPGHEGVDIMAPSGSNIYSVAPGTVSRVNTDPSDHNWGIFVVVDHQQSYQTIYCHLEKALVKEGDEVQGGTLLGLADNTGNSFGSHLQLTFKKLDATYQNWPANIFDPTPFLLPLLGWQRPAGPYVEGWFYTASLTISGELAQVNAGGSNLRRTPSVNGELIDVVPGGTIVIVSGANRGQFTPVQVATVALSQSDAADPSPPESAVTGNTVDGWGLRNYIEISGDQGLVGQHGINLRAAPKRIAHNIGLVTGGSTVTITGEAEGEYLPIRVDRSQFSGPIQLPQELAGEVVSPAVDSYLAWAFTANLRLEDDQAVSGRFGTNLRHRPARDGQLIGLLPEGATAVIAGLPRGEYTPVWVNPATAQNVPHQLPEVEQPEPLPAPAIDTTPGWAFTGAISISGSTAVTGEYGLNLRDTPRRNGRIIGFVPASTTMLVSGSPKGEYTPVRVNNEYLLEPQLATRVDVPDFADSSLIGNVRIGLHASADPDISPAEIQEFAAMRPGIIKALSFHNPDGLRQLSAAHPSCSWIVRAFLHFGGRKITPGQFLNDTLNDVQLTLAAIDSQDVVIELHNEPNLVPEGLDSSWQDGYEFNHWFLECLSLYRQALPDRLFLYPGLSPGAAVKGIKQDHNTFMEASRQAIQAADGLGVHLFWSNIYPMERALDTLDDIISRFPTKPIWITEASNNKAGTSPAIKGRQYLQFWQALQQRPTVQGVTYFVASASNPAFKEEVWVGRGIGQIVGRR